MTRQNYRNYAGQNLNGENLSNQPNLLRSNFTGTQLSGANLSGSNLNGSILEQANMFEADLSNTKLRGCNLKKANLKFAQLTGADLRGVEVEDACFIGSKGITQYTKKILIAQGAIFEENADRPQDRKIVEKLTIMIAIVSVIVGSQGLAKFITEFKKPDTPISEKKSETIKPNSQKFQ